MSLKQAAGELNLTPSAVSHHIKSLEVHLGQPLFVRLNRGLRLTETGMSYYRFVREAVEKIDEGTSSIQNWQPSETLRIRTGASFAHKWLLPRLAGFLAENPHIELLIDTRGPASVMGADPVDVEIRYGPAKERGYEVQPLRAETILPLCSPALLAGPYPLRDLHDLAKHTLIESELSVITWSLWLAKHADGSVNAPRLRFDRTTLALQAAVYGLGVVLEGDFLASEELAAGRLVTPFSLRDTGMRTPLRYLIIPKAKKGSRNVRLFKDWLMREMGN